MAQYHVHFYRQIDPWLRIMKGDKKTIFVAASVATQAIDGL